MIKQIISIIIMGCVLSGCFEGGNNKNTLTFSVTSDYPPFEYISDNELVGFDIELARLIAKELGMEADFKDMQFGAILVAVQNGMVDASISTLTVTEQRLQNFDFSTPYYHESLAVVTKKGQALAVEDFAGKTIGCQLGSTMESWLQKHHPNTQLLTLDTNPQVIEALKSGYIDGVLIDEFQAKAFIKQNAKLEYKVIAKSDSGYAIAFKKGSPLVEKVNQALAKLQADGQLDNLKQKYLVGK